MDSMDAEKKPYYRVPLKDASASPQDKISTSATQKPQNSLQKVAQSPLQHRDVVDSLSPPPIQTGHKVTSQPTSKPAAVSKEQARENIEKLVGRENDYIKLSRDKDRKLTKEHFLAIIDNLKVILKACEEARNSGNSGDVATHLSYIEFAESVCTNIIDALEKSNREGLLDKLPYGIKDAIAKTIPGDLKFKIEQVKSDLNYKLGKWTYTQPASAAPQSPLASSSQPASVQPAQQSRPPQPAQKLRSSQPISATPAVKVPEDPRANLKTQLDELNYILTDTLPICTGNIIVMLNRLHKTIQSMQSILENCPPSSIPQHTELQKIITDMSSCLPEIDPATEFKSAQAILRNNATNENLLKDSSKVQELLK